MWRIYRKKSGHLLLRLEHPSERTLARLINYDEAVKIQKWFNEMNPAGSTEIYTVTEIAILLNKPLKKVVDVIREAGIGHIKVISKVKIYNKDQIEQIKEILDDEKL